MASSQRKVKMNRRGFYEVRRAPKLIDMIDGITKKIADEANSMAGLHAGYRTSSRQGKARPQGRWRGTAITADSDAQQDNAENNTLLKAFNRVRGT